MDSVRAVTKCTSIMYSNVAFVSMILGTLEAIIRARRELCFSAYVSIVISVFANEDVPCRVIRDPSRSVNYHTGSPDGLIITNCP